MGELTAIEWTDHTFNAWIGCAKVSAECKNCYAEVETFARRERARGLELWGEKAARHVTSDRNWKKPLAWNHAAEKDGVRRLVFCSSMSDVFEDRRDLDAPRARLWALIRATPHLTWLLLTKRPESADRLWKQASDGRHPSLPRFADDAQAVQGILSELDATRWNHAWQPNVWLGTTAGTQEMADKRIPYLLRVPCAARFLSCEPLLGPVDVSRFLAGNSEGKPTRVLESRDGRRHMHNNTPGVEAVGGTWWWGVDWVIGGGESGARARPCDVVWLRSLRDQCKTAGIPFFAKQLGAKPYHGGNEGFPTSWLSGVLDRITDRKGGDIAEWPEDLRVREFPIVTQKGALR